MAANQFKNIALDHTKVAGALSAAGAADLQEEVLKGGRLVQHSGVLNGTRFLIRIYVGGNGKCTIGHAAGYDRDTYDWLAPRIQEACGFGNSTSVSVALPRFAAEHGEHLLEFLAESGARMPTDERRTDYRLVRFVGPLGDAITIKLYNNGTLQLQGVHGQIAARALDLIQSLLPLEEVLAHQKAVYAVPLSLDQIKRDLEARVPNAHDYLNDAVRIQLSSALALTKIGIELEDYSALAFPALRSLEGFCFQLLHQEVGLDPAHLRKLGEFFEDEGSDWRLASAYHGTASAQVQKALVSCFKQWMAQRHRLFHMDGTLETTRILEARHQAVAIVNAVLDEVEASYQSILRSRGGV